MGFLTPDTVIDRVVGMLQDEIDAEVDLIDAHNNALSVGTDNEFTTPAIPDAVITTYDDTGTQGEPIRIVVNDEGDRDDEGLQVYANEDLTGTNDPLATEPELQRTMRFSVTVLVRNAGGSQTTAGATSAQHARRVCNRVAEGCRVLMARRPALSRTGGVAAIMPGGTKLVSDSRAQPYEDDAVTGYGRQLIYEATTFEKRA